jgi:hypothetical protein
LVRRHLAEQLPAARSVAAAETMGNPVLKDLGPLGRAAAAAAERLSMAGGAHSHGQA